MVGTWVKGGVIRSHKGSGLVRIGLMELLYELRGIIQVFNRLPGVFLACSLVSLPLDIVMELSSGPFCPFTVHHLLDFILQGVPKEDGGWRRFQSEWEGVRMVWF